MRKRPTTVNLNPATRERLECVREKFALGGSKASLADVAGEAIERGLSSMLGDTPSSPPPSGRAA